MNAYVASLYEIVLPLLETNRTHEAINVLKLAIAAGGHDPFLLYALGNCQFRDGAYDAALVALTVSIRIDPSRAPAFNDLAAALFVLGRDAEALASLRRALTLHPGLPEAEETDAIWLLRYGRFRDGWRKYEARFATRANVGLRRNFVQPRWQGEPLHGRTILLHAEQGYGDALQFVRYAPLVAARGGRVVLQIYPGIDPLIGAMPGIAQVVRTGQPLPPFDLECPLLSLPLAFGTELDSIPATTPYLSVPDDYLAFWRRRLGPRTKLRIGVAWSGNPAHKEDRRRSIPFDTFATLLAPAADIEFHVLQTDLRPQDAAALHQMPHVHNHAGYLLDFADTGALVSLMDLVISVDTSVVHLAGALDRPVWLLLAHPADWRWMQERDDSPWYPSMWLLRQPKRGDWLSVLAMVRQRLQEMLA